MNWSGNPISLWTGRGTCKSLCRSGNVFNSMLWSELVSIRTITFRRMPFRKKVMVWFTRFCTPFTHVLNCTHCDVRAHCISWGSSPIKPGLILLNDCSDDGFCSSWTQRLWSNSKNFVSHIFPPADDCVKTITLCDNKQGRSRSKHVSKWQNVSAKVSDFRQLQWIFLIVFYQKLLLWNIPLM